MSDRGYKIVDAHLHVWDLGNFEKRFPNRNFSWSFPSQDGETEIYRNILLEEAVADSSKAGVKNIIFMQVYEDCPEEVRWVEEQARNTKGGSAIKAQVAGFDIRKHDDLKEKIKEFKNNLDQKLVGIRMLIARRETEFMMGDDFLAGLKILEDEGLTFDLLIRADQLETASKLAPMFPNLKFVIDHLGSPTKYQGASPLETWKNGMELCAKHPNMYVKLSAMIDEIGTTEDLFVTFKPYIKHIIDVFGTKRCFFGSDWPVCQINKPVPKSYEDVVKFLERQLDQLSLREEDKKTIFQDNAIKFYGLEDVVDLS